MEPLMAITAIQAKKYPYGGKVPDGKYRLAYQRYIWVFVADGWIVWAANEATNERWIVH